MLTSLNEGLPLSILEAMAAGLAVVATRVGGTPELVTHGETGLLVEPEDAVSTAEAIRELLTDVDLRSRMGARGRTLVLERYTAERMVDGVLAVYDEFRPGPRTLGRWSRRPRCLDYRRFGVTLA